MIERVKERETERCEGERGKDGVRVRCERVDRKICRHIPNEFYL